MQGKKEVAKAAATVTNLETASPYDAAVVEFERICASRFHPGDLEAINSKLDFK